MCDHVNSSLLIWLCYSKPWLCANGYWWDPTTTTKKKAKKERKWPTGGLSSHQNTCLLLGEWEPIISPQVLMNGRFFPRASLHTSILRWAADHPVLSFEYSTSFHTVIGVNHIDSARFVEINPSSKAWVNDWEVLHTQLPCRSMLITILNIIICIAQKGVSRPRLKK